MQAAMSLYVSKLIMTNTLEDAAQFQGNLSFQTLTPVNATKIPYRPSEAEQLLYFVNYNSIYEIMTYSIIFN